MVFHGVPGSSQWRTDGDPLTDLFVKLCGIR